MSLCDGHRVDRYTIWTETSIRLLPSDDYSLNKTRHTIHSLILSGVKPSVCSILFDFLNVLHQISCSIRERGHAFVHLCLDYVSFRYNEASDSSQQQLWWIISVDVGLLKWNEICWIFHGLSFVRRIWSRSSVAFFLLQDSWSHRVYSLVAKYHPSV